MENERTDNPTNKKISFQDGERDLTITTDEISSLFSDIDRYDSQFSLGNMLGAMLRAHFEQPIDEDELEDAIDSQGDTHSAIPKEIRHEKQSSSALTLTATHVTTLDTLGLELAPVEEGSTIITSSERAEEGTESAREARMRLAIINYDRFLTFLRAVDSDTVASTCLKDRFPQLAKLLQKQIRDCYDLGNEDNQKALPLLDSLDDIVAEYRRLGLGECVEELALYKRYAQQNALREYIAIQRQTLFNQPGEGFGPGDWQIDSTPELLEERWFKALGVLERLKKNPEAEELYVKLRDHLSMCLDKASNSVPKRYKQATALEMILAVVKGNFRMLTET